MPMTRKFRKPVAPGRAILNAALILSVSLGLAGGAAAAGPAQAESPATRLLHNHSLLDSPPASCKSDDLNNFQLQQCGALAFRDADRSLNRAYQKALGARGADAAKVLRTAQRSWLSFRDQECEWESDLYQGGTLAPVVFVNCLVALTQARTQRLTQALEP
jgi:uncharacterized protein YecT (DUF1311 family)